MPDDQQLRELRAQTTQALEAALKHIRTHPVKYTDADAVSAVEAEDPLDIAGAVTWPEISTPANPSQNILKLFARASGDSIQLVALSAVGQEVILATLLDGAPPPAKKFLLLGVQQ